MLRSPVTATGLSQDVAFVGDYFVFVTDIYTYASENIPKFVMGENSFDNWDGFVEQIKAMNIDRRIEIYQSALDRYNNR